MDRTISQIGSKRATNLEEHAPAFVAGFLDQLKIDRLGPDSGPERLTSQCVDCPSRRVRLPRLSPGCSRCSYALVGDHVLQGSLPFLITDGRNSLITPSLLARRQDAREYRDPNSDKCEIQSDQDDPLFTREFACARRKNNRYRRQY